MNLMRIKIFMIVCLKLLVFHIQFQQQFVFNWLFNIHIFSIIYSIKASIHTVHIWLVHTTHSLIKIYAQLCSMCIELADTLLYWHCKSIRFDIHTFFKALLNITYSPFYKYSRLIKWIQLLPNGTFCFSFISLLLLLCELKLMYLSILAKGWLLPLIIGNHTEINRTAWCLCWLVGRVTYVKIMCTQMEGKQVFKPLQFVYFYTSSLFTKSHI